MQKNELLYATTWLNYRHILSKSSQKREYILYTSIYMKIKNRQNLSMMTEVRIVVSLGARDRERHRMDFGVFIIFCWSGGYYIKSSTWLKFPKHCSSVDSYFVHFSLCYLKKSTPHLWGLVFAPFEYERKYFMYSLSILYISYTIYHISLIYIIYNMLHII